MTRDLVLHLVKLSLLGLLTILLLVRIWQGDEVERRILDLQGLVNERAKAAESEVSTLDERATKIEGGVRELSARAAGIERGVGELRGVVEERFDRLAAEGVRTTGPALGSEAAPEVKRATPSGETPAKPPGNTGGAGADDPRTLPYWPSPDNILADLSHEPYPPAGAPKGGIIKFYTTANPASLNEHVVSDAELQERICGPVYEHIAEQSRYDPDLFIPGLCNRVTVSADFKEFTCYVRKGVYWHKPFLSPEEKRGNLAWLDAMPRQEATAEDIKFTFDVVRDPQSECGPQASYLGDLDRIEVLDRYTVKVVWKRSLYYNKSTTLNLLLIFPKFIFERDAAGHVLAPELIASTFPQHWFNNKMCGTGPFRFAGFEPNQVIRLRRNDDWWDPQKPVIDGIDLRIVAEAPIQLAMFKAGELDVLSPYPNDYRAEILEGGPGSIKEMIDEGKVTLKKWEMFGFYFVGWNMRLPQLREREVRRALAHLFPKDRVIRDVMYGLGAPCDGPVHHWENSHVKDLEQFPYDPAAAARLLDEAGWRRNDRGVREKVVDGELREMKIKLLYPSTSPLARDATLLFQKSAADVGVTIEPFAREWSVMEKMLDDKDFDAAMLGWGSTWDGDPSQLWHSESARAAKGSNFCSYISPELDDIIEKLKTTFDIQERQKLWEQFQRIIVRDQPYCFTYIRTRAWCIHNRLGNPFFDKMRPQEWFVPWTVKDGK